MAEDSRSPVDELKARAGTALQAVVVYSGDRHRDLYRRSDVADLHASGLEAEVIEDLRAGRPDRTDPDAATQEGTHRASVEVFEHRVIVHLPRGEEEGTVIFLDPAAASDLVGFVEAVRADVYGEPTG